MSRSIYLHRLGCPKLEVDHDLLLAGLREAGARTVDQAEQADTVIISTCAFIGDARAEAVEAMLEGAQWKDEGVGRELIVSGCLPARYRESLAGDLPEVDGWYAPGEFAELLRHYGAGRLLNGTEPEAREEQTHGGRIERSLEELLASLRQVDERPWAYLKIAEGCDRRCAYCAIPNIRGPYRSRRAGSILSEASRLLAGGVRELVLTAEEINSWGRDLGGGETIHTLLPRLGRQVADVGGWLRLLYSHPPLIDDAFIETMASTPGLVPYLDFPIEHADDGVLRAMGRGTDWASMERSIEGLRRRIDRLVLRSSVIVGHPGEDEAAFDRLLARLEQVAFERLGVFRYSPEEGTRAEAKPRPSEDAARDREDEVNALALEQAESWYAERVGEPVAMLVEGRDEEGRPLGRSEWDAPEIDGDAVLEGEAEPGQIVQTVVRAGEPFTLTLSPEQG